MKKLLLFAVLAGLFIYLPAQVTVTNVTHYVTRDQMLLANEINESGEPFAEALGYNLDDLDPMVLNAPDSVSYTLGIENYEYSRYQLGTIVFRSGMGLHMMWGPVIMEMASMMDTAAFDGMYTMGMKNGYNEDDMLMKNIMHFGMLAHQTPPANPWPQFAEFMSGDPHLPQTVDADHFTSDFSTLRWDRSKMDMVLNPGTMGQTLMKQYLWAQDMLGSFHDSTDAEVVPGTASPDSAGSPNFDPDNNVYYGGDALDGFIGQVLTAEAINKVKFIITKLAYNGDTLGMVDPATYDPSNGILFFPHMISVTESPVMMGLPPKAGSFTVIDGSSDLFDQVSLLWGTLNFKNMMMPGNNSDEQHIAYQSVFDGNPFPAAMSQTGMPGPFDLMMGTSKVIFLNLMTMHFNPTEGTFVDESGLDNGNATPGSVVSTINAGYTTMILAKFVEEFTGTGLQTMAEDALNAQAAYLAGTLKDANGGFYNGYTIGTGPFTEAKTAVNQAAAARGLYAAYALTSNANYLAAADAAYQYLIDQFYVPSEMAFRTEEGEDLATYTPFNFAVIAGGLREATLVGNHAEAAGIYTKFFKKVANAIQLSEAAPTGETGSDSDGDGIPFIPEQADNLPPVFAAEATLQLTATGIFNKGRFNDSGFDFSVYPNPFTKNTALNFYLNHDAEVKVEVFNVTGKKVQMLNDRFSSGRHDISWNTSALPAGLYYFKLTAGQEVDVKKVMKIR